MLSRSLFCLFFVYFLTRSCILLASLLWMRSGRHYLRYLAQMAVYEDTDSTNKRNYDVTLGSVLRYNFALPALFLPR